MSGGWRQTVALRFRDVDAMGVVHHTVPLLCFEEARAGWWAHVRGSVGIAGIDYILGEVQVRYHAPLRWPGSVEVVLRAGRIGGKSFDLEYEIRGSAGDVLVSGRTAQVMFDYAAGVAKPIPDQVRAALVELTTGSG